MMWLNGVEYEVLGEKALPGFARTEIELRKKNGKKSYFVVRYEDGSLSSVV